MNQGNMESPFSLDEKALPRPPTTATENERLLASLGYISQLLLPLLMPILLVTSRATKQSGFVRHHATQAIALVGVGVLYDLLVVLVLLLMRSRLLLMALGAALLVMLPVAITLWYAIHALRGRWIEIPLVTNLLKDLGLL